MLSPNIALVDTEADSNADEDDHPVRDRLR